MADITNKPPIGIVLDDPASFGWALQKTPTATASSSSSASAASAINSVTGTANQIAATTVAGAVTLGLAGPWNATTFTANGVLFGNTNNVIQVTAQGAVGTVLHGNAGAPTFTAVSLTVDVSGVLPVANGGTNASTASITSFNNITGFTAAGTTGTTSTNLVFSTSPTFITPTLGVATGTRLGLGAAADATAALYTNGFYRSRGASGTSANTEFQLDNDDSFVYLFGSSSSGTGKGIKLLAGGGNGSLSLTIAAGTGNTPGNVTVANNLIVSGVGPHAIGGATIANAQWFQTGSFTPTAVTGVAFDQNTTLNVAANQSGYGFFISPTFTKAGSGTHPALFAGTVVPSFTAGASTITDVGGWDIQTFTAPANTTNATGIRIAAPTAATNNYAARFFKSDGSTIIASFKGDGTVFMPNLTTSGSAQTAYVCLDGSGQLISDSVSCLVSTERFKINILPIDLGLREVLALRPILYHKLFPHPKDAYDRKQQVGFSAEEAAKVDERLAAFDKDGKPRGFRYEQYTAVLTKAIQELYTMFLEMKGTPNA